MFDILLSQIRITYVQQKNTRKRNASCFSNFATLNQENLTDYQQKMARYSLLFHTRTRSRSLTLFTKLTITSGRHRRWQFLFIN